jgi:REP element-mobilizing transposase RayT
MRSYRKGSHTVHDLKVHLVWITKYRYNVLTKEVGLRIRELIRQVCDANEVEIIQGRVSKDHIHLYPPTRGVKISGFEWCESRRRKNIFAAKQDADQDQTVLSVCPRSSALTSPPPRLVRWPNP